MPPIGDTQKPSINKLGVVNTIFIYLLVLVGSALIGCVSALVVFSTTIAAQRYLGFHREMFASGITALGLATSTLGQHYNIRWLSGVGLLLWGWVALLPLAIVAFIAWRCFGLIVFAWQRLTSRYS